MKTNAKNLLILGALGFGAYMLLSKKGLPEVSASGVVSSGGYQYDPTTGSLSANSQGIIQPATDKPQIKATYADALSQLTDLYGRQGTIVAKDYIHAFRQNSIVSPQEQIGLVLSTTPGLVESEAQLFKDQAAGKIKVTQSKSTALSGSQVQTAVSTITKAGGTAIPSSILSGKMTAIDKQILKNYENKKKVKK